MSLTDVQLRNLRDLIAILEHKPPNAILHWVSKSFHPEHGERFLALQEMDRPHSISDLVAIGAACVAKQDGRNAHDIIDIAMQQIKSLDPDSLFDKAKSTQNIPPYVERSTAIDNPPL